MTSGSPGRSFAVSVVALALVRLAALASGFVVGVLGARVLTPDGFGAAGVALTTGMMAALVSNGGVNIAAIYLLGRHPDERRSVVSATAMLAVIGSVVAVVLVLAFGSAVAPALSLGARPELFLAAASVAVGVLAFEYGGAVLLGIGRTREFTIGELLRAVATLAGTALLLLAWASDSSFVLAAGLGYVGGAAWALLAAARHGAAIVPGWHARIVGRSLEIGLRGQAGNVLQFLNLRLDLLLIPLLLDLRAAGLYLVAVRASEVIIQGANAASSLIFPSVAARTDDSTLLTERTIRMSLLVVIAAVAALVLAAQPLLDLAFGAEYADAASSLRILALGMIPLATGRILAGDLKGRGRAGLVSLAAMASLVLTVALDLTLIPTLGIAGAALASLVAYTATAVILLAAFRTTTGADLRALVPRIADATAMLRLARPHDTRRSGSG